jgi:hypothetical protein
MPGPGADNPPHGLTNSSCKVSFGIYAAAIDASLGIYPRVYLFYRPRDTFHDEIGVKLHRVWFRSSFVNLVLLLIFRIAVLAFL